MINPSEIYSKWLFHLPLKPTNRNSHHTNCTHHILKNTKKYHRNNHNKLRKLTFSDLLPPLLASYTAFPFIRHPQQTVNKSRPRRQSSSCAIRVLRFRVASVKIVINQIQIKRAYFIERSHVSAQ